MLLTHFTFPLRYHIRHLKTNDMYVNNMSGHFITSRSRRRCYILHYVYICISSQVKWNIALQFKVRLHFDEIITLLFE